MKSSNAMSQSLSKNLIHLIFSTKGREPVLTREVREDLHRYCAGILKDLDSPPLVMSFWPDHVHVLFSLNKNLSLARAVMELKRSSSKWLKTQGRRSRTSTGRTVTGRSP
jgi:REP element-mobilizing transposase RayT